MAITNVEGSTTAFTVITETEVEEDFLWHSDGNRILLSEHSPKHAGHRLFVGDPKRTTSLCWNLSRWIRKAFPASGLLTEVGFSFPVRRV